MLGERLKSARNNNGLSLRALQHKIGNKVTAQALGKYERNEMMPTNENISVIAKVLNVTEDFLLQKPKIHLGEIKFRENSIRSKKEELQVKAKITSHLEKYLEIEEILNLDTVEWDSPREIPFKIKDIKDVELASMRIRAEWNLGNEPIKFLAEFLEDRGIKVIIDKLPESISGVTCFVQRDSRKDIPTILINENITSERQRFTMAHELGHIIMENSDSVVNTEKNCQRFAGAFLMPEYSLSAYLGRNRKSISLGELLSLKKVFGTSVQAIAYRCKDLEIINNTAHSKLYKEFDRQGWLTHPYEIVIKLEKEETQRFKRLCYRAIAEELISINKAERFLGVNAEEIKKAMNIN